MRALEPMVRAEPERWLSELKSWLNDENKWVQRAGVTVVGRLPMKHPALTQDCLDLIPPLLNNPDKDVQKGVSFAIRLCARGEIPPVVRFLKNQVPPQDPAATWVLCDVIRSMTKRFLPEFKTLRKNYQSWAEDPQMSSQNLKSINSALKVLQSL
jgi:3-methyladenine DNA glycosylase AlkD